MVTNKLHKRTAPPPPTPTKAARLCAQRAQLDSERLSKASEQRNLAKQIETIDDELIRFAKAAGKTPVRELARWRVEVVQVPGSFSFKTELISIIGLEELNRLAAAVPTRDRLQLTEKAPAGRSKKSPLAGPGTRAPRRRSA